MPGVPGIQSYTSVAASNTTLFPENMPPSAVNDGMRQVQKDIRDWYTDAEWVNWGDTPSRASATTFKIATDVTGRYPVHRRLKCYDATTIYSTITASSYSAPDTTVTVVNDSGSLTASLTSVALAIITPTSVSVPSTIGRKGADIASATTTDIWAGTGDFVDVTGTTTITGLGTAIKAGIERDVRFTGALTLTHNGTSLILPGAANITTAANDTAIFRSLDASGNALCISYKKADGTAVSGIGITTLGALTAPDGADELPIYDTSATTNKKITLVNMINGQVEDTAPDSANDYIQTYDASATNTKKVKITNLGTGMKLLQTNTSSNSAISEFNALFASTYDAYWVVFDQVLPATDAGTFQCQFGTGATPTYVTANYRWGMHVSFGSGSYEGANSVSDSKINITSSVRTIDNATNGVSGTLLITGANASSNAVWTVSQVGYLDSAGSTITDVVCTGYQPAATFTAVKFFFASGNITSGKVFLYGLKNT